MAMTPADPGALSATGTAGGGMVAASGHGHQKVLSVVVTPEVVDPSDLEMLQDLILAAVNDAMDKARDLASKEMGSVTAGLGLPPGLL